MLEYSDSSMNIAVNNLHFRVLLIVFLTEMEQCVQQLEELIFGMMKTSVSNI